MDKKILFVILAIALFVIGAGCKEEDVEKSQQTTQPATEPEPEKTIIEQIIGPEKPSQEQQMLLNLINRTGNIKSYSYKDFSTKDFYYVKGDKIKIRLSDKVGLIAKEQYETVYLDRAEKKAFAQCADRQDCTTIQRQNYRVVNFYQYNPKTPLEIVDELKSKNAEVQEFESRIIENSRTTPVNYTDGNGNEVKLWLNELYAFPYEIDTIKGENIISISRYTDVAFNRVSDSDVTLPEGLTLVG